jgi:hypothetical protein
MQIKNNLIEFILFVQQLFEYLELSEIFHEIVYHLEGLSHHSLKENYDK